jgi:tetratricopeptide (TPR) repeat protein
LGSVSDNGMIQIWDASKGIELPRRDDWRRLIEPRNWKEFDRLIDEKRWSLAADLLKEITAAGIQDEVAIYRLALVNLELGDEAGYRDACRRMLLEFGKTEQKLEACSAAWACALRPATVEDYGPAIALAERAFELARNTRNPLMIATTRYSEALGAILFRAGRYADALRHLRVAHEAAPNRKTSSARVCCLLAMTHQRLGHAADARMWLDRANQDADEELSDSGRPPTWDVRLTLELLRAEATALLATTGAAGQAK